MKKVLLCLCTAGLATWYAVSSSTESSPSFEPQSEQHPSLAFCQPPPPAGTRHPPEMRLIAAARRASPRFWSVAAQVPYRPMGVFFSEALALVAMVELVGATHLIESGTAQGQSTELLARFFEGTPLRIITIDRDSLYGLHAQTSRRLAKWPAVRCLKGDSFELVPKLLDGLPPGSRAVVFVDGPKGRLGLRLATLALRHRSVGLVALHDTAAVWDDGPSLHEELRGLNQTVLMTSLSPYRPIFAPLDAAHDEPAVLRTEYAQHDWPKRRIAPILSYGNGLWIGARPGALGGSEARRLTSSDAANAHGTRRLTNGARSHVAMSASANQFAGLFACIVSLVDAALEPHALTVHLFVLGSARARASQILLCLRGAGHLRGAQVSPSPCAPTPTGNPCYG